MQFLGEKIKKKYFVYADVNLKTNLPFYYGSGAINRIIDENRNSDHNEIAGKCNWARYIIHQSDSRKECYDIEKIYIAIAFNYNYETNNQKPGGKRFKEKITNKIVDSNNINEYIQFKKDNKSLIRVFKIENMPNYIQNRIGRKSLIIIENRKTNERYISMKYRAVARFVGVSGLEMIDFFEMLNSPMADTGINIRDKKNSYLIYKI